MCFNFENTTNKLRKLTNSEKCFYIKKNYNLIQCRNPIRNIDTIFIGKHTNVHKQKKKKYTYIITYIFAKSLKEFRSQF